MSSELTPEAGADLPQSAPRLTLSELVRLQLAALARGSSEHSSVELVENAKHETQVRVAVRTGDAGVETPDDALAKAFELYAEAQRRLGRPMPDA